MTERTVEVRVAVAVDAEGSWQACGWKLPPVLSADNTPDDFREFAEEDLLEGCSHYILTATLPIPEPSEPEEVRAEVEEVGGE